VAVPDFAGTTEADQLSLVEADGSVSNIGPVWPDALGPDNPPGTYNSKRPYTVLGAASNASRGIVFTIENSALQWQFDTTQGSTLYEYTGTNNVAPSLVAVSGGAGSTALISRCGAGYGGISADGQVVFFTAQKECEGGTQIYARLGGSRTVAISEPSKEDCEACQTSSALEREASFEGSSADGSKVLFTTEQELLPGQKGKNLYEYDFDAERGRRIALISAGATEPQVQAVSRVSLDGSHVYFVAGGVLSGDPNGEGQRAQAGADNLYVYERDERYPAGHTAFVADLCSGPEQSGTVSDPQCPSNLESSSVLGAINDKDLWNQQGHASDRNGPAQVTPDGRFLVFASYGDLTVGDTSSARQVFQYDAQTGALVRVSIGQDNYNGNGNAARSGQGPSTDASIVDQEYLGPASAPRGGALARTMSDDGSDVFFQSPVALTPGALNLVKVAEIAGTGRFYAQNVYEFHRGNVFLISDGKDVSPTVISTPAPGEGVALVGVSALGNDVFFRSVDQLVPQDTETQVNFYDARVGGGFPAPAAPASCEGEGCQAPSGAPPVFGAPGSANFAGSGNLTPPAITPAVKPKALTRAQELTKALKACKKKPRKARASCDAQAHKRYGAKTKTKAKKSDRRGK
jgi:hypothetical protein